jgi:hypothetical protein
MRVSPHPETGFLGVILRSISEPVLEQSEGKNLALGMPPRFFASFRITMHHFRMHIS